MAAPEPVACARHHNVETYLRCGRCETPICPKCLVHTPVGARCPDCARPTRISRPGGTVAYLSGGAAGFAVGALGGALMPFIPGGLLILLLTGYLVGEAVSKALHRRGGRGLAIVAFVAALAGPVLGRLALLLPLIASPASGGNVLAFVAAALLSFGGLELLLLVVAGVIASTRIDR